ncbi:PAS domain S-box protein [Phragmitibacter flavus]|uniref:histidine kinase n=1 Tax=Phragmitibacter flavus TaxID=2576071 RepID=A0A5R8KAJ1_9BACT|nr:PAS domain S-box protein [Phragmitibacter flavus]TLD69328.1 PAS domain S-box protein [Phragmitibacter flavus]
MDRSLHPTESTYRASILLVDENEASRVAMVELLQPYFFVSAVVSTQAGLSALDRGLPDMVLCDEHNGPALLKSIRGNPKWETLLVLLLTKSGAGSGAEEVELLPRRVELLADDYLPMPCPAHHLLARVQTHLKSRLRNREMEERLRENEAILQSLMMSATDCLMMVDLGGEVLWISESGRRSMEMQEEVSSAWRRRSWMEFWSDPVTQQEAAKAMEVARRRGTGRFRGHCPTAEGNSRWWEVTVTPILNATGQPGSLLCVMHDVTEMMRAEQSLRESESRWRELTHAIPHLVWSCTPDAWTDFLNGQWEVYSGIPAEENLGDAWQTLVHPEDIDPLKEKWSRVAEVGPSFSSEMRILRRDGEYRWFKVNALPERDVEGRIVKWYGSNTEIEDLKRAEAALRENEARLAAIFQQAGAGIVQMDAEGRYLMVNDAYCEITGRDRGELMRLTYRDTTHPEDFEVSLPPFNALFEGGPPFVIEKRYLRPDGSHVWARKSLVGMKDEGGNVVAALAIVHDISESREAENELLDREAQLSLVTNHAPVLLAQLDANLRYKFVNRHYAARYEVTPEAMVGKALHEVIGFDALHVAMPFIHRVLAGERVEYELNIPYSKLGNRWTHVVYVPDFNTEGKVVSFLVVLTDMTARKQSERELEQARDEALAASRAKDDFLARLSHELRTPLNPALLVASEAASNPLLPKEIRSDFETIRKHVDLEARLIDDLLDLTSITRNKLTLESRPVHIQSVLEDAIKTVQADASQKRLRFDLRLNEPRVVVNGDAVRLQQIVWNVLKNAIKFSAEGTTIQVATRVVDGRHVMEIRDDGIGMVPEELERIFHAFAQGQHAEKSAVHRFGGLGLGLTISRMLVELHNGEIRAESGGRGEGSAFFIELPVAELRDRDQNQAESTARVETTRVDVGVAPRHLRILLVEDHEPTREAMASLLKRRQHQVVAVGSVAEGLKVAETNIFDLLISDIGLPDGSGYDLMEALHGSCGIPGIALTGYGMEQDVERSREVGFATHLTKPVRVQVLEEAIVRSLSR